MGIANVTLAEHIREIANLREKSWKPEAWQGREGQWYGEYQKDYDECIHDVVGDDPIGLILSCLFTAGYCEMYDFCDQVLGEESKAA
jgi:hypothetical protein